MRKSAGSTTGADISHADGGKHSFNPRTLGLQPGREFEVCPELRRSLVDGEPGGVGRNFEQDLPRFPEIDGLKIAPVQDIRNGEARPAFQATMVTISPACEE